MATSTFSHSARILVSAASAAWLAACGGSPSDPGQSMPAALSAECSDPSLITTEQTLSLWPPNHKMHEVRVEQCVTAVDACDGALQGEFIWASSDEPIDSIGDGHHAPDVGLGVDTGHVCIRSERQGPKDGRVYKLGVRITDADGNAVERACTVVVDHDRRGRRATDSGEAYRVALDPSAAGFDCEGNPSGTAGAPASAGTGGSAGSGGDAGDAGDGGEEGGAGTTGGAGGPSFDLG